MKYIDADKLIAEIERRKNQTERRLDNIVPIRRKDTMDEEQLAKIELRDKVDKAYLNGVLVTLSDVLSFITSLQQEQPPLPSNLDEAANNYGVDIRLGYPRVMDKTDRFIYNAFKAGAEWMAGQGETFNGFMSVSGKRSLIAIEGSSQNFKFGEGVIVQIRKKEK